MSFYTDRVDELTQRLRAAEIRQAAIESFAEKGGEHRLSLQAETDQATAQAVSDIAETYVDTQTLMRILKRGAALETSNARERLRVFITTEEGHELPL